MCTRLTPTSQLYVCVYVCSAQHDKLKFTRVHLRCQVISIDFSFIFIIIVIIIIFLFFFSLAILEHWTGSIYFFLQVNKIFCDRASYDLIWFFIRLCMCLALVCCQYFYYYCYCCFRLLYLLLLAGAFFTIQIINNFLFYF